MHDTILNLIASCLGAALGCFSAEFYLIPFLKKKLTK
jgi:hypothetical protein